MTNFVISDWCLCKQALEICYTYARPCLTHYAHRFPPMALLAGSKWIVDTGLILCYRVHLCARYCAPLCWLCAGSALYRVVSGHLWVVSTVSLRCLCVVLCHAVLCCALRAYVVRAWLLCSAVLYRIGDHPCFAVFCACLCRLTFLLIATVCLPFCLSAVSVLSLYCLCTTGTVSVLSLCTGTVLVLCYLSSNLLFVLYSLCIHSVSVLCLYLYLSLYYLCIAQGL